MPGKRLKNLACYIIIRQINSETPQNWYRLTGALQMVKVLINQ